MFVLIGRVVQMDFDEIHTTSSRGLCIVMGDFVLKVSGNQRIGIRAFQNIQNF